jgi:hypothetical protein
MATDTRTHTHTHTRWSRSDALVYTRGRSRSAGLPTGLHTTGTHEYERATHGAIHYRYSCIRTRYPRGYTLPVQNPYIGPCIPLMSRCVSSLFSIFSFLCCGARGPVYKIPLMLAAALPRWAAQSRSARQSLRALAKMLRNTRCAWQTIHTEKRHHIWQCGARKLFGAKG